MSREPASLAALVIACMAFAASPAPADDTPDATEATIRRDTWGVPHIFAPNLADGAWRELTTETVTIAVKDAPPVVRTIERSHHGPIALREGRKAFAIACPYFDQIDLVTQSFRAMTARNLAEFDAALAMCQMMEQNIMYADQTEKLFSPGRLKPTWFQPSELDANVESTKVLRRGTKAASS